MRAFVATSYVSDGTMRNKPNPRDPQLIANRQTWLQSQGIDMHEAVLVKISYAEPEQNYCRYREVTLADKGAGMFDGDTPPADALVTTQKGLALFLPVADCVATTFYDETHGVLMLAHLGRHSLEQHGGYNTVTHLQNNYGVDPAKLQVWLSATVNKDAYQIHKLDNKGMKEALYEQLIAAGIDVANITDNQDDTATDPRYFSHSEFLKGNKAEDGCFAMVAIMRD